MARGKRELWSEVSLQLEPVGTEGRAASAAIYRGQCYKGEDLALLSSTAVMAEWLRRWT